MADGLEVGRTVLRRRADPELAANVRFELVKVGHGGHWTQPREADDRSGKKRSPHCPPAALLLTWR